MDLDPAWFISSPENCMALAPQAHLDARNKPEVKFWADVAALVGPLREQVTARFSVGDHLKQIDLRKAMDAAAGRLLPKGHFERRLAALQHVGVLVSDAGSYLFQHEEAYLNRAVQAMAMIPPIVVLRAKSREQARAAIPHVLRHAMNSVAEDVGVARLPPPTMDLQWYFEVHDAIPLQRTPAYLLVLDLRSVRDLLFTMNAANGEKWHHPMALNKMTLREIMKHMGWRTGNDQHTRVMALGRTLGVFDEQEGKLVMLPWTPPILNRLAWEALEGSLRTTESIGEAGQRIHDAVVTQLHGFASEDWKDIAEGWLEARDMSTGAFGPHWPISKANIAVTSELPEARSDPRIAASPEEAEGRAWPRMTVSPTPAHPELFSRVVRSILLAHGAWESRGHTFLTLVPLPRSPLPNDGRIPVAEWNSHALEKIATALKGYNHEREFSAKTFVAVVPWHEPIENPAPETLKHVLAMTYVGGRTWVYSTRVTVRRGTILEERTVPIPTPGAIAPLVADFENAVRDLALRA